MSWTIAETDDFIAALGLLPGTSAVRDVIAELLVRLEENAGTGEKVEGSDCWIIKSTPGKPHNHPGILLIYRLDRENRRVLMLDAQLIPDSPRAEPPPRVRV